MRWTGRAFLLFALVSALCGASFADRQTPSVAPTGPTAATDTLPAAIAPALARDAGKEYAPRPASDGTPGLVASNPAQHLIARFLPGAVRLHGDTASPSGGVSWGMRLLRTGYGADLRAVPSALPAIDGTRVTYARGDATEWYLNSPLGIEQGFTLAAPPATSRMGNLRLAVALDGVERVEASGAGLSLTIPGDGTVQYGHLLVTDARGRSLPAWFVPMEGGVQIVVDDRAAVYPVTVDPLVQAGKLVASDAASGDEFGFSVAVSSDGNLALIGADGKAGFTGAAYIFTRSGGTWTEQRKLTASDAASNEGFGVSVALSADGSIALIGADGNAGDTGAAYLYRRTGNTWGDEQKLTPSDGIGNDGFGFSVSLSGDGSIALIGAEGCSCTSNGAAYVYTRSVNTWGNEQKLTASDGAVGDAFGGAVTLSGDGALALIGASGVLGSTGAAYSYTRSAGVWGNEQKLTASDGAAGDAFGLSVALNGDASVALIGTPGDCGCSAAGAAYAYAHSGNTWAAEQKLVASDGAVGDGFGYAVALSADGSRAVIGAIGQFNGVGGAYLFGRTGPTWAQQERIGLTDGTSGDLYGGAVATSADGSTTLIGALGVNGASGAAYAFPAGTAIAALPGTTPQSTAVTTPFATPLAVHVTDTLTAVPLVDVPVRFVASPVGASGTFGGSATADVTTDGNGDATAPAFTANATNGSYVVSVAVGGVTTPVFNLTNLPTSATRMAIVTGNGQSATIGTALVDPLSVVILDASGNGISGVSVTFTAPASGASGTFVGGGATANVTTNSNGFANAPLLTANTVAGAYTVTATATGITTPARFSLANLPGAATHFALAFLPNVQAGKSAPLTLTALDVGGNAATNYTGTIHFTSTDPAASLPANYTFLPGDTGIHAFSVTLSAVGSRTVTATDTSSAITGSQSVNVTPSITTVTPVNGPQTGGGPLTLVGVGLTGATGVTVGGVACTNIAVNGPGTDLICKLPTNQPAGTVDVTVTTPNGAATLAHGYTFLPASPALAPSGRGSGGRGVGSAPAPAPASR